VANDSIRGAASAAARIIEQQAQAASPARISDSVKQAGQQAAKALDSASTPIKDAVREMPKQAKAIAQLAIESPLEAPIIIAKGHLKLATTGLVAVHKAHVQMAKAIVSDHKEVAAAASTLTKEQKLKIATNPGFVLLPPGLREMAIAGEIKRQAAAAGGAKKAANND
jgi:hypothetical protein